MPGAEPQLGLTISMVGDEGKLGRCYKTQMTAPLGSGVNEEEGGNMAGVGEAIK